MGLNVYTKSFIIFIVLNISYSLFSQERKVQVPSPERIAYTKKGLPADTIREYDENGVIKSLHYLYKKTYRYKGEKYHYCLYIAFNEQGNRIRFTDDLMGIDRKFSPDGDVISERIYNRKNSKEIGYVESFPGHHRKTVVVNGNKYDYDENDRLRRYWVRKNIQYNKQSGLLMATIYFQEYDVSGETCKYGRLYSNLYEQDPWLQVRPEFPVEMDSVPLQDFKEIVYPQLNMKEIFKWDYNNNKTIITQFEQDGDSWNETVRRFFPRHPK